MVKKEEVFKNRNQALQVIKSNSELVMQLMIASRKIIEALEYDKS